MASIDVLSEIPAGGSKVEKTSSLKGKTSTDTSGSTASTFTDVLNSQVQSKSSADSKGQSSTASDSTQGKQSTDDSESSSKNTNGQGANLGYANLAFPFFAQLMLQNELPAGKEANSGDDVSQGIGKSSTASTASTASTDSLIGGNKLVLALLNFLSQSPDEISSQLGTTMVKSQGNNPVISELDKYKQVITDLLGKLSGEITDISEKGTSISSANVGLKNFSQDMAKVIQGWMASGEGTKDTQNVLGSSTQKEIQALVNGSAANSDKNVEALSQAVLSVLLSDGDKSKVSPTKVDGSAIGADNGTSAQDAKTFLTVLNSLLGEESNGIKDAKTDSSAAGSVKDNPALNAKTFLQTALNSLNGSGDAEPNKATLLSEAKGDLGQHLVKEEGTKTTGTSEEKVIQSPNSSINLGQVSNISTSNITDEKTISLPVWQQISAEIREQVMNKSQDLKQLDIQLHPEDLGKIQIDLRWENGQLHLQVQASQAATGQLLQNQLPDLRQALMNQGINCGMLQMGMGGEGKQNSQGNNSSQSQQQHKIAAEDEDVISVLNIPTSEENGNNQINVTA